jgi:hypothetical protein
MMDIQAEHKKAKAAYTAAAEAMEKARTNGDRLSLDPAKRAAAEKAFADTEAAAAAAYEQVDDLEKIAKRRAERDAARANAAAQASA